jgi:hypothetical protein
MSNGPKSACQPTRAMTAEACDLCYSRAGPIEADLRQS